MTYEVGTKVLIDPSYEGEFLECLADNGIGKSDRARRTLLWLQHEVTSADEDDEDRDNEIRLSDGNGSDIWVHSIWLDEAEWDPMTEPLTPGDECKIIVENSYHGLQVEVVHVDAEGPDGRIQLSCEDWGDAVKNCRRKDLALYDKRETELRKGNKVTVLEGDKVLRRLDRGGIPEEHVSLMMGKRFTITDHTMRARFLGDDEYEEGFLLNTSQLCGRDYWVPVDCVVKFEGVDDTAPSTAGTAAGGSIKQGDKVRVLNTTQELLKLNRMPLLTAAKLSKRENVVLRLGESDAPAPYRIKSPLGVFWADKVEKVSA